VLDRSQRSLTQWFNTSVFTRPTGRGDIGNNCDTAKFTLPGFNNQDISIFKNFPITEKTLLPVPHGDVQRVQPHAVQRGEYRRTIRRDGQTDQHDVRNVTSARDPRRMQFSLRFNF
jgi:hypothetical protein